MAFNKHKVLAAADKYIAKQNYNKALNELLKVVKVTPNDTNLLNKVGDLYSKIGNTASATSYFSKVADSYQNNGFNLKAIAVYKKILRIDRTNIDARDRMVELYIQQGHTSEAKGELRLMAEHNYKENLLTRALGCYQKMLQVDPNNLDARLKITEILVREGRREEAAGHFVAMGQELLNKNMVHEAQKMVTQGLKLEPGNTKLQILIAQIYLREGKSDQALQQLTELCRKNDQDLDAIRILGSTYLDRGQLREAKACFLRALHISSDQTEDLEEVARLFIEKGELDEAHATLQPLAEMFIEAGKTDDAIRLFRSILYVNENHEPSHQMLVHIYLKSEQTANAILTLEKMINHHQAIGNKDAATELIRQLLDIDPNNLEWRSKLEAFDHELVAPGPALSQTPSFGEDAHTGIHSLDDLENDHSVDHSLEHSFDPDDAKLNESGMVDLEPDDAQTQIANHLTEADVFMKYGILDQAYQHLMEAKKLDPLNLDANSKLKQLHMERNETDKAVGIMVEMVSSLIEQGDYGRAHEVVSEIEPHRPDVARVQYGRLEALDNQDVARMREDSAHFALDMVQDQLTGEDLGFRSDASADVVDFSEINQGGGAESSAGDWSLDMPAGRGGVRDLSDLYNPELTGDKLSLDLPATDSPAAPPAPAVEPAASFSHSLDFPEAPAPPAEPFFEMPSPASPPAQPEPDLLPPEPQAEPVFEMPEPTPAPAPAVEPKQVMPEPVAPTPPPAPPPQPVQVSAAMDSPSLGSHGKSLTSELEEIDFFISVEAFEDARNLLMDAHQRHGDHPLIMERLQEIEAHTSKFSSQKLTYTGNQSQENFLHEGDLLDKDSGFFDLAAELSEELFDEAEDVYDKTGQEEIQSVEELFEEFKKGVEEQIDEGDYETHYDLGIAYKEMGLLEEAVIELRKAEKDPSRFLECNTLIGSCFIEQGKTEEAINHFEGVLQLPNLTQDEMLAFQFDLALAYQGIGELDKALACFMQIKAVDPQYRDLATRIEALV